MAETAVQKQAVLKAEGLLAEALAYIKGLQGQLSAEHGSLQRVWQGTASDAFTVVFGNFEADFTTVIKALEGLQNNMGSTHAGYVAVDTNAASTVSSKINTILNH
jgi:WXG100 family type VII secretion target